MNMGVGSCKGKVVGNGVYVDLGVFMGLEVAMLVDAEVNDGLGVSENSGVFVGSGIVVRSGGVVVRVTDSCTLQVTNTSARSITIVAAAKRRNTDTSTFKPPSYLRCINSASHRLAHHMLAKIIAQVPRTILTNIKPRLAAWPTDGRRSRYDSQDRESASICVHQRAMPAYGA
jgi:hypothetical protein